jgi:hypothetical protein
MKIVKVGEPVQDFFQNDSTVPVWLEGPKGVPINIACGHAKDYSIFEIQFVFSRGMLTMEDGGLFWRERRVVDSNTFKGYRVLNEGVRRAGKYANAMKQSVDNIHRAITKGEPLISSGDSALFAQQMCEKIKQMVIAK